MAVERQRPRALPSGPLGDPIWLRNQAEALVVLEERLEVASSGDRRAAWIAALAIALL